MKTGLEILIAESLEMAARIDGEWGGLNCTAQADHVAALAARAIGRCKDCELWGPDTAWGPGLLGLEVMRICNCDKLGESHQVSSALADGLQYQYSEGGSIQTGPEFGCIHFTPRDQDPERKSSAAE